MILVGGRKEKERRVMHVFKKPFTCSIDSSLSLTSSHSPTILTSTASLLWLLSIRLLAFTATTEVINPLGQKSTIPQNHTKCLQKSQLEIYQPIQYAWRISAKLLELRQKTSNQRSEDNGKLEPSTMSQWKNLPNHPSTRYLQRCRRQAYKIGFAETMIRVSIRFHLLFSSNSFSSNFLMNGLSI